MYRNSPSESKGMPSGIPYIIGNEAAERFSFYGMKTILAVFIANYLHLMGDSPATAMSQTQASSWVHQFNVFVYLTPLLGAILADIFFGKYKVIMWLSVVYCLGHGVLALMGITGDSTTWLIAGLALITLGSGGIKPCVSAHVGDQFGKNNQHLLSQIFNWFYFSINLGAFLSTLATPVLLLYYGPHLAFGIPGVLMAIATLLFWIGRNQFVHIPPQGKRFREELWEKGVLLRIVKMCIVFLFVAIFWALFDQTGTSWVFQAQDMQTTILGIEILPSQLQAFNPILILCLIPLFTYVIYPAIDRFFPLTPLRKIGIGLFTMVVSFALVTLIQTWIDNGESPSISWQLLAYILLTSSEVMVSIVCLEFAYTQAPKSLKSFIMAIFLASVAIGNQVTAIINYFIQIDSPLDGIKQTTELVGYDLKAGTEDDLIAVYNDNQLETITFAESSTFSASAQKIKDLIIKTNTIPTKAEATKAIGQHTDAYGNAIHYELLNSKTARIRSNGADEKSHTQWDLGYMIQINDKPDSGNDRKTWLQKRKEELGIAITAENFEPVTLTPFVGGSSNMTTMEGAEYFQFFTYLMLGTAVAFIPFALSFNYQKYQNYKE